MNNTKYRVPRPVEGVGAVRAPYKVIELTAALIAETQYIPKAKVVETLRLVVVCEDFDNYEIYSEEFLPINILISYRAKKKEIWLKHVVDLITEMTLTYVSPERLEICLLAAMLKYNENLSLIGTTEMAENMTFYRKDFKKEEVYFINGKTVNACRNVVGVTHSGWGLLGWRLLMPDSSDWKLYSHLLVERTGSGFTLRKDGSVDPLASKLKIGMPADIKEVVMKAKENFLK